MIPTFKVCVFGEGGSGKTTFVKRVKFGDYDRRYIPTMGVEVHPLTLYTNNGPVTLNVWDCAGQERFGGLRDGYYVQADAGICFASPDSKRTYRDCVDFRRMCEHVPVVVVWGKCDVQNVPPYLHGKAILHSVKCNTNLTEPLLVILRKLLNDPNVQLVEAPAVTPPAIEIPRISAKI